MLVLTRKSSETIVINSEITIHVLRIRGGSVRIGINAPPEVSVRRGELSLLTNGSVIDVGVADEFAGVANVESNEAGRCAGDSADERSRMAHAAASKCVGPLGGLLRGRSASRLARRA